ncbi:hypothetical protein V495_05768 [Pseudogymnoascus sp. VKM F-4514 (FW-929)]|nr:hypothetical protein V495_05768 [Pseudogymnoascus sp. VKM F-4514 (FW-929)]KFY58054.1 hypothetical protein V497_05105 [Pseudogymnoascus sp. VKM F-4516 (FW-969)]
MGSGSRVISVIFRLMQLVSAAVVAGTLGHYLHNIHEAGVGSNRRVVYAIAIAGISIFFALVLTPPLTYSFYAFPVDFAIFVCWMVAFGLLVNLVGSRGCNSTWFRTNWGWAWGRWYRVGTAEQVGHPGCSSWRAAIAWAFIGGFFWLLSFLLGIIVLSRMRGRKHEDSTHIKRQEKNHMASGVTPIYPHETVNGTEEVTQNQERLGGQRTFVQSQEQAGCSQCGTLGRLGTRFCSNCGFERTAAEAV